MPAPNIATDRMSGPPASDTEVLWTDAPRGIGDAVAAETPARDAAAAAAAAAAADMLLEYWYFCSDDSPFRPA